MASKRHIRRVSCSGKARHKTADFAEVAAVKMRKKTGDHFNVYKCRFCNGYHIGHKSPVYR